ncbi:MAG: hypothetical protein ABIF77_00490 [bacterium]
MRSVIHTWPQQPRYEIAPISNRWDSCFPVQDLLQVGDDIIRRVLSRDSEVFLRNNRQQAGE